jgi:hypothetical protein
LHLSLICEAGFRRIACEQDQIPARKTGETPRPPTDSALSDAKQLAAASFTQQSDARRKNVQCHHPVKGRDAKICIRRRLRALAGGGAGERPAAPALSVGPLRPKNRRPDLLEIGDGARPFAAAGVGVERRASSNKEPA